ncbi:MAG: hypothetical protein AAF654_11105 [Myxococcota bacterium]
MSGFRGIVASVLIGCAASNAPAFAIQDLRGEAPATMGRSCGDSVPNRPRRLIVFSTPGCEPCRRQMRELRAATLPDELSIQHVIVGETSCNTARMESGSESSLYVMDDSDAQAWGFHTSPTLIYIDGERACRMAIGVVDSATLPRLVARCEA